MQIGIVGTGYVGATFARRLTALRRRTQRDPGTARPASHDRRPGRGFPAQRGLAIVRVMVNDPFGALAHPIRRGIVERLARGSATVGAATSDFNVSKPAISRHLKVLEHAGVVERTVEGRTHRLVLNVAALTETIDWLDHQRAMWDRMFDAVEDHLAAQQTAQAGQPARPSKAGPPSLPTEHQGEHPHGRLR